MKLATAPVHYRIVQNGVQKFYSDNVIIEFRGDYTGTVGDAACFSAIRLVDFWDRRRGRDITADTFNGPATIEVLTPAGEVVGRIGLASFEDVAAHRGGEVAYA
jgi:hypothetical protein